ncbi:hypothetical protein AcV5_001963 [Taiwanofungus camphoratus]|nr:hypothetical protein AcV5_001963 [Antrodia cinnamomea]
MSSGLPLRDRPQSNSPDSNDDWPVQSTTPLRIAKRDSPQRTQLARRQSSSYNHLRNNNLVTKSPFRSQIPTSSKVSTSRTLSPRRVSGEKRPRPTSMLTQAENEHPLGFKRRQSKGFQGLLQNEPVTKSPFRQISSSMLGLEDLPPSLPPKFSHVSPSPSPGRSSLVSKRLHGPRDAEHGDLSIRRHRRKTVTFDERCDVVEFDVEEDLVEGPFVAEDEQGREGDIPVNEQFEETERSESSQMGDDSITGLVDFMLQDAGPHTAEGEMEPTNLSISHSEISSPGPDLDEETHGTNGRDEELECPVTPTVSSFLPATEYSSDQDNDHEINPCISADTSVAQPMSFPGAESQMTSPPGSPSIIHAQSADASTNGSGRLHLQFESEGTLHGLNVKAVVEGVKADYFEHPIDIGNVQAASSESEDSAIHEQAVLGYSTPSRVRAFQEGRPSRRRSLSTGDAEDLRANHPGAAQRRAAALRNGGFLQVPSIENNEDPLADSIDRELKRLGNPIRSKYHIHEHHGTIYASSDTDRVSHIGNAGDVDNGKAWRAVKRPSDMNEYSRQIKELRAQDSSGKAHGKVFVKVLGLKGIHIPLPSQPTIITCTLNNGIHFVTTPESPLSRDCRISQEFELIEHSKLEFTLTIKVRRDPHIVAQFKANIPPPPRPPPQPSPALASKSGMRSPAPASKGGMRSFFLGSSPKKANKKPLPSEPVSPAPPAPAPKLEENFARYLKPDGTLARAFISFRDIVKHCDTKLFETSYPLIGQKSELGSVSKMMQIGDIVLQIFRLPPLVGIPPKELPQSLEECHRGLRHVNWHKVTYFEGTLTQNGGDCMSWRRRHLRIIGASLVAYNDVTKRAITTIDLKKAIAVEDDQETRSAILSPASAATASRRYIDEYDGSYGVERSFRLKFTRGQEILFFADTDEDKAKWLEVFRALIGRIPPNPLWAELVWQRQQEPAKQTTSPLFHNGPSMQPLHHQGHLR